MLDRYPRMFDDAAQRPPVTTGDERTRPAHVISDACYRDASRMSGVFAMGTLINTPKGRVQIECLSAGDGVLSFQNGKVAVQNCLVLPDAVIPDYVLCVRAGYLNATEDLITLPQQLVRLNHWLAAALFETRFPFVTASHVCLDHRIDRIPRARQQFLKLDLGVCEAVTANGVMCITDACPNQKENSGRGGIKSFEHRELTSDEVKQALDAGSFFRRSRKKS